jgi:hypothetical protein
LSDAKKPEAMPFSGRSSGARFGSAGVGSPAWDVGLPGSNEERRSCSGDQPQGGGKDVNTSAALTHLAEPNRQVSVTGGYPQWR